MFEVQYDGYRLRSKSARGLFVDFVKSVINDDKYKQQIEELIVSDGPTAGVIIGRKVSTYNGRPNSVEVAAGICYTRIFLKKRYKE